MEFEEQRAQFFQEYETRDDYMEGREGMDMVNTDFKVSEGGGRGEKEGC